MELKQLEYFITTCEKGSFNQAAECLYTTQPNVSRIVGNLEKELGRKLFERTSRGIIITPYGKTVLEYAQNVMHNVNMMNSLADYNTGKKFALASYSSNMISRLLTDFYREWRDLYAIEYQEGSVEEITNWVAQGISEIGVVYLAQKQIPAFQHILGHKKLKFIPMDVKEACVYVGPHHPKYQEERVDFSELADMRFARGVREYFSMEHHLDHVSLGAISTERLRYSIYTNSDHMMLDLLLHTDVCSMGIDFMHKKYEQYKIKGLKISNCEPFLTIGYVCPEEEEPGEAAMWFLRQLQRVLRT